MRFQKSAKNAQNVIKETVEKFVYREKSFTSMDISQEIKKKGIWVRNIDVASWLRDNFSKNDIFADYSTTPTSVRNGSKVATQYHPTWADPDEYKETDQIPMTPDDVKSIRKSNIKSVPDIVDMLNPTNVVMSKVIKSKERIKIPGAMIRELGYGPGDKVPPDVIKSTKKVPDRLTVNSDCRFSIPRSYVRWGTSPVKVLLTDKNSIVFEKA